MIYFAMKALKLCADCRAVISILPKKSSFLFRFRGFKILEEKSAAEHENQRISESNIRKTGLKNGTLIDWNQNR